MRYINQKYIKHDILNKNPEWEQIAAGHLLKMKVMTPQERKTYIETNTDWNLLQQTLLESTFGLCWYSEASPGSNFLKIDHFRPKSKAMQGKGKKNKDFGYWWLAYTWENFRLAGDYVNLRMRDRLNPKALPKGKGSYFPLDLTNGKIAADEEVISCETNILLDPCKRYDVSLITFDEDGSVIPCGINEYENFRALSSIDFYNLNITHLNTRRQLVWDECCNELEDAKEQINNSPNEVTRRIVIEKCYLKLTELLSPKREFTSVAKACIHLFAQRTEYKNWLKNFIRTI